jgi:hypothetical protein
MPEEQEQQPKIIVDEDWKQQAKREKEVLKAQEEQEKKKAPSASKGRRPDGPLPQADFAALINMLATQALFSLGLLQIKGQPERQPDLELARYNIDLLETIEEKTKGNLTQDEQVMLKNTLNELRMGYVEITNAMRSQSQQPLQQG